MLAARLRGHRGGSQGKGKKKTARSRLPVDDVIASAWRIAARIAQPFPPLYRTLRIQSPVAGRLLEDAVRGTVVDRLLQPLAQVSQVGETLAALLVTPIAVMALSTAQVQGNPVMMQAAIEAARHGLMAMMRVGGPKFAEQLAREREDEARYGADVDTLLELILSAPLPDPDAEEAKIADMVSKLSGEHAAP